MVDAYAEYMREVKRNSMRKRRAAGYRPPSEKRTRERQRHRLRAHRKLVVAYMQLFLTTAAIVARR